MARTQVYIRSAFERVIDVAPGRASLLLEKKEAAARPLRCLAGKRKPASPSAAAGMLESPPRGSEAAGIRSTWGASRSAPTASKRESDPPASARNAKGPLPLPTERGDPSRESFRAALGAASPRERPNRALVGKRGWPSRPPMTRNGGDSGACTTKAYVQIIPNVNAGFAAVKALSLNRGQKRGSPLVFLESRRIPLQKKAKLDTADLRRVVQRLQLEPADLRRVVQKRLRRLRLLAAELQRQNKRKPQLKAFKILKEIGKTPSRKCVGEVPGVEVGDEFYYRAELMVAGVHGSAIRGIDSTFYEGVRVATCVVSQKFKGYVNLMEGSDVLVYSGEGGNPSFDSTRRAPPGDQKLERGNRALKNSMDLRTPVRVVHGFGVPRRDRDSPEPGEKTAVKYVYDGLYMVEDFWWEVGRMGFRVLKFQMRRLPGQPKLELKQVLRARVAAESASLEPSHRPLIGQPFQLLDRART